MIDQAEMDKLIKQAQHEFTRARMALGLQDELLAGPALLLKARVDTSCSTAWTDGISLGYNPEFMLKLSHRERVAVIAHEALHAALLHPWRRDLRKHFKWNIACDHSVNNILTEHGYQLPDGAVMDKAFIGKSPEEIYNLLPDNPEDGPDGPAIYEGWGGELRDAPKSGDEAGQAKQEMSDALDRGIKRSEMAGRCPASLKRDVSVGRSTVDWKSVLRRFVQTTAKDDFSWSMPSRRAIARGIYLPTMRSEAVGHILIAVDTSGSIDGPLLSSFMGEINGIASECSPRMITVMSCDAKVHWKETFEHGEPVTVNPIGGGGTDFRPVFDEMRKMDDPPVCIVYLTDLYGSFPDEAPEIPTLWVTPTIGGTAPFGEVVEVIP